MELSQLQAFIYITEEKSFSGAAKRMFLTQPAISMQIKSLEQNLGQTLFDRSKKAIYPTEAGRILYKHAKRIINEIEYSRNEIDKIQKLVRGQLTIGASDTVSSYILPSILSDFLKKHPNLEITVQNRPTQHIIQMVLDGAADIGLVTMPASHDNLIIRPFRTYHDIAVCSPDHPLAKQSQINLASLANYRLLLLEPGTKSRNNLDETFARKQITVKSLMEFGSVEVQKAFAKTSMGAAIVPDFAVSGDVSRGILKKLRIKGIGKRTIGVIVRKNRILSLGCQEFMSLIQKKSGS